MSNNTNRNKSSIWKRIWYYRWLYLILLPGIVYFAIFSYGPMYGLQLAFKDYSVKAGIWGSKFVGTKNFELLFRNPDFFRAMKNTLVISFLKIIFGFPAPIILALAINEVRKKIVSRTLQTIFTLPHFLSWVVLAGILMNFLGNDGTVNNIIAALGENRVGFLRNAGAFQGVLVITNIWKESGWTCIMYLAALTSIDQAQYESATLDGAGRFQKMLYITWPGIRGMAAMLLVLAVGGVMNANFDQIFNLYNPTVLSSGDIIDTYVYRISFEMQPNYGFSTAVGLFKGVINCILLLVANKAVSKLDGNSSMF